MKGRSSRDLISVGLIAIALTAGFVSQVNGRCDHAFAVKSVVLETLSKEMQHEPDTGALVVLRQQTAQVLSQVDVNSNISNEAALYERLMKLGEQTGVRIDRVDPVKTDNDNLDDGELASYGAHIDAVGSYEAFAQFIHEIETKISYSSVVRFDLAPVPGGEGEESLVHGNIETRHLRLGKETLELVASVNAEVE